MTRSTEGEKKSSTSTFYWPTPQIQISTFGKQLHGDYWWLPHTPIMVLKLNQQIMHKNPQLLMKIPRCMWQLQSKKLNKNHTDKKLLGFKYIAGDCEHAHSWVALIPGEATKYRVSPPKQ